MIPPAIEERLRAHVASVLGAAHVPRSQRADLEDELYGHLVERWQALVADGVEPMAAAERAVANFGTAGRIGRDLTRTYRGRFWASTIGVLLPTWRPASAPRSPGLTALYTATFFVALMLASAATDALSGLSPIRGFIQALLWATGAAGAVLTAEALLRRQRWALYVAIVLCTLSAIDMAVSAASDPELAFDSFTGVVAGVALAIAGLDRRRVWAATDVGTQARSLFAAPIAAIVAASYLSGPVLAAFPGDPAQASEADLDLRVRVRCDTVFEETLDAEVLRWRVHVSWEWSRTSLLPGGLRGWERYTDMLVLRHPGGDWWLAETQAPQETFSRLPVGWQGGGDPAEGTIPRDLPRSVVEFAVLKRDTQPSVRYQAAWVMKSQAGATAWPDEAEAWYFHGDHWSLVARAGCDDSGQGHPPGDQQQ